MPFEPTPGSPKSIRGLYHWVWGQLVELGKTSGGGGVTLFTGLTDTPSAYSGAGNQAVRVNGAEDALEFFDINALLAGKSDTGHLHTGVYSPVGHTHAYQPIGDYIVQGGPLTQTLDASNEKLDKVLRIDIDGQATEYASFEKGFLVLDQDHSYDFISGTAPPGWEAFDGIVMPSAIVVEGTHTFGRDANLLGSGILFYANMKIVNESGLDILQGPYYTLAGTPIFEADDATVTHGQATEIFLSPVFQAVGASGLYDLDHHYNLEIRAEYKENVEVNHRNALSIKDAEVADVNGLTRQVGLAIEELTGGDNNAYLVLGRNVDTAFTGDHGIYLVPDVPSYLGGDLTINGNVLNVGNLPTSSAGLSSGDAWIDTTAGRVIKVVA